MNTCLLLILLIGVNLSSARSDEQFSRVRIVVPDGAALDRVWSTGIDFEGATGKIGGEMEFVTGLYELQQLSAMGIPFSVTVDDLAEYYEARLHEPHTAPSGFGYGSMGGYYTFTEVVQQLDSMRLLFPTLITSRDSIGTTNEGRTIWAAEISDNPGLNEPGEPEVLYTSLHHAREPEGMMSVLYYMWWLLQNYGTNQEATYLVNNRQLWFMPVVNPDGYVYNQTTNPNGGGMWRKNRRNNGGGTFGVDPNRNYGPMYMWNSSFAPNGSSTSPSSDTYRGTAPFSEPENQAIDNFMRAHNIRACLNYHTYGNYLIYPFGYLARENGDSLIYRDWAYDLTAENRFTNGTDMQTVNYSTRGVSDDYMYGDTTKPVTYTMTPEVGTTGFWPTIPEIFPLAIGNLSMNKRLAYLGGQFTTLLKSRIEDANGNGFIEMNEDFTLRIDAKNKGLVEAANLAISVSSSLPSILFSNSPAAITSLPAQAQTLVTFAGHAASNASSGIPFQIYLQITDIQGYQKNDTINLFLGTPTTVFVDSASTGTSNWTTGTGWGLTSDAHSLPSAFTDSPLGPYAASASNSLSLVNQLNLTGFQFAQVKFWTKWAIEPTWDFATVEVSTNNGSTWTTIRTQLSHRGSARSGSQQPSGSWGFDSYTPGQIYVEQGAELSAYVNRQIKLRFRVAAEGGDQRDGFYVDDIRVYGYTTITTDVNGTDTGLPVDFVLHQNYPNPFNPETSISFDLPKRSFVALELFNLLGQKVATAVQQELPAGTHSYRVGAETAGLSSGVYMYKLTAGDFVQTRKMVLLR